MKKKIMIIHHYGGLGGAGLSLLHIIENIDRQKFEIIVACPTNPSSLYKVLSEKNCELIPLKKAPVIFNHYNGGLKYLFSIKSIKNILDIKKDKKRIKKLIKIENPDIVIVNSMTLFWIGKISKKMNKYSVCFHRESYKLGKFNLSDNIIKRGLNKNFDKVAFISNYDEKITGLRNEKSKVIYDRVEVAKYLTLDKCTLQKKYKLSNDKKYILYVGGPSKLKGAYTLIDAIEYMKPYTNLEFIFLGWSNESRTKEEKLLRQKIKEKDIESKIIFFDLTDKPEIFFCLSDIVVFPSTKAHQSRPVYEAGISKKPIIISEFENTKEFISNNQTGFTFNNKDPKELADIIEKVVSMPKNDLDIIIDKNFKNALKRHDFKTLQKDLNDLLKIEGEYNRKI